MINLYILQFNNYYNRTIHRHETIEEYRKYVLDVIPNINNFDYGDGINTAHIFPYKGKTTPDYALITEEDELGNETIKSRWFVIESTFIRGNKFEVQLRRDLIADNLSDVLDAPCMVEKGFVNNPLSDYSIFNSEGQDYNQIKQDETPLYDQTGCPWIVGYFTPPQGTDDFILKPTNIEITSETSAIELDKREDFKYWEYFENNPDKIEYRFLPGGNADNMYIALLSDKLSPTESALLKYMRYFNLNNNYSLNQAYALGIKYSDTGYTNNGWVYYENEKYFATTAYKGIIGNIANEVFFKSRAQYDIYDKLKDRMGKIFNEIIFSDFFASYSPYTISSYYNGKIFKIDGKYYEVEVSYDIVPFNIPLSITQSNYLMEPLSDYFINYSGEQGAKSCTASVWAYNLNIKYKEKKNYVNIAIERNQYVRLEDSPYGMFCLPYSDELKVHSASAENPDFISNKDINLQVATSLSALLGEGVILDLQLVPYCPLQQNIQESSEPKFSSLHVSKSYIRSGEIDPEEPTKQQGDIVGHMYWCNKSSFKLQIPYILNINNYKEENELDMYRLCSPGYKSVFEFNAAKNGGIDGFHVDCTYKPYNPFILIHPNFNVLYRKNYEDNRGLICTDDLSLPRLGDQWATYELNNKNYANTFYREIQSAKLENKYSNANDIFNMFSGTIQGTGSGITSGMITGGPIGAGIGGTLGGLSSLGAGIADVSINQKLRNDQIDKAETLFKYNLENIKARPQTVSKSSPININNKYVPFLEKYSCSDIEKELFRNKIKYTGMTILKTSTLRNYLNYIDDVTESYVKGSIIRFPRLTEDFHYLKELSNEVGKGFYLGRENY